jgi:hypothetical protein
MALAWKGLMILGILNTLGAVVILHTKPIGEHSIWLLPAWSIVALLVVSGLSMGRNKAANRFRTGISRVDQRFGAPEVLVAGRH